MPIPEYPILFNKFNNSIAAHGEDIILTGTPEGVIMGYPEEQRVWLKEGDKVTIEIEKLGRLTNIMKQEET